LEEAASAVKCFSGSKTLASTFVFGPVGGLALSAAIVSLSGDLAANTRSIAAATANLTCWLVAFNASGNYEWVLGCHCLVGWKVVVFVFRMGRTLEAGVASLYDPRSVQG
jgi:hypothetical protein